MLDPTSGAPEAQLHDSPPEQMVAWLLLVAEHARDDRWPPNEVADVVRMLGLDSLALVRRSLARHGHAMGQDSGHGTGAAPGAGSKAGVGA
ncbi:hypothetical protein [Nocardioides sp. SYSU DS0651]|uniref:hypothetical protein n=1 Tax=Nocardioides sp. SYSU DS0651 TaxID=3415955 RepID=UPI003F4C3A97